MSENSNKAELHTYHTTKEAEIFAKKFAFKLDFAPKNFYLYFDSAVERLHNELSLNYKKNLGVRSRALSKQTHLATDFDTCIVQVLSIKHLVYDRLVTAMMSDKKVNTYFQDHGKLILAIGKKIKKLNNKKQFDAYAKSGLGGLYGASIADVHDLCELQFYQELIGVFFGGRLLARVGAGANVKKTTKPTPAKKEKPAAAAAKRPTQSALQSVPMGLDEALRQIDTMTNITECQGD